MLYVYIKLFALLIHRLVSPECVVAVKYGCPDFSWHLKKCHGHRLLARYFSSYPLYFKNTFSWVVRGSVLNESSVILVSAFINPYAAGG